MPLSTKQTAAGAALISALLASAGGVAFLHKHPDPTLREAFKGCEAGELSGIVCCEDVLRVTDQSKYMQQCAPVTPENHDPLGVRAREEDDFDLNVAKQKAAFVK